jgi:predicted ATP-dependent serine protease
MIYEDEERPGQAVDEMVARWEEQDRKRDDSRAEAAAEPADKPLIKTSAEFVADFTPPDYVLDGILQRRFCYSFTGKTGAGKTAILLRTSAHVWLSQLLGEREVAQGRVLYFAGENPTDIQMRWIALAQQMGFDINAIGVHFIPGTFKISELRERIQKEAERVGGTSPSSTLIPVPPTSRATTRTITVSRENTHGASAA